MLTAITEKKPENKRHAVIELQWYAGPLKITNKNHIEPENWDYFGLDSAISSQPWYAQKHTKKSKESYVSLPEVLTSSSNDWQMRLNCMSRATI